MKALILSGILVFLLISAAYSSDARPTVLADLRLLERVIEDEEWVIIDCRDKKAYSEGHIMRAISLGDSCLKVFSKDGKIKTISEIEKILGENGITPEKNIIVYSDAPNLASAITAMWVFGYIGHERVQLLGGGIESWIAAEIPLIKAETKLDPTVYKSPIKK